MAENQVAGKYSLALFNLGRELGMLDSFYQELISFQEMLGTHRELKGLFYYHQLPPEKKIKILREILQGQLSEQVLHFLLLLIDKRREGVFIEITGEFSRLYFREKGIKRVEVISAVELKPAQLQRLEEKLQEVFAVGIQLSCRVKPEIIGGLIVRIGDYLIDGSVRKELNTIRERIDQISANQLGVADDAVKA